MEINLSLNIWNASIILKMGTKTREHKALSDILGIDGGS